MTTVAEPPRGFALTDFTNIPNPPPDDSPKPAVETAPPEPVVKIEEPPIKPLVDDEPEKKPEVEPAKPDPDADDSMETAMRRAPERKADDERAAAEKKKQDEAAAEAEKAKAAGVKPESTAAERDKDLNDESVAHVHPKTRKIITDIKAKTKAARDERDAMARERDALKTERDQLTEKAKAAPVPKELEEEVKTLRERVRELDITKDPLIEAKYDRRIVSNNQAIIATLKAQGYGMVEKEGKMVEDPKVIAELMKTGLTLKSLNPLIKKLDEADLVDEAESIREAVRQNSRISTERTQEIDGWKADHGRRQQAREQQTKQQVEQQQAAFTKQTDTQYRAELATLEKDFTYLRQPAAPLTTDTPVVAKAKQAALDEYNAAATKIETEVRALNFDGAPPERHAEIVGRINANAILAIALKTHVLPKALRDIQTRDARIKELEGELAKIRDAGKLSRLHASQPAGNNDAGKAQPLDLADALKMAIPGQQQG